MNVKDQVPKAKDLLKPTLRALDALGGSASVKELNKRIASDMGLSNDILDIPYKGGGQTEFYVQATAARTRLNKVGAIRNSAHGVWVISGKGRAILNEKTHGRVDYDKEENRGDHVSSEDTSPDDEWKDKLLNIVRSIPPDAFERLCKRVLREAGLTDVDVTQKTRDHGIDGFGVLRVNNLLSFRVLFQCKKYSGQVGASAIRDFRGAMYGRTDRGLFITTGTFSSDAAQEADRDGLQTIDLVNGHGLCDLLKEHELGVRVVEKRVVERVEFDHDYFKEL